MLDLGDVLQPDPEEARQVIRRDLLLVVDLQHETHEIWGPLRGLPQHEEATVSSWRIPSSPGL